MRKISPVGVDVPIDKFQAYLSTQIVFPNISVSEWYPSIYVNPFDQGKTRKSPNARQPEHFVFDSDNEYKEVFNDDKIDLLSFFLVDPFASFNNETKRFTQRVSMIFMVNLQQLYPGIAHRADEEFHMNVYNMWKVWNSRHDFNFVGYETRTENVFREFEREKIMFEDMHPRHCVRFNFDVTYEPSCCTDC